MAKLYFRYGAMNCGKSTAIMQVGYNYYERGMNAVIMKPMVDTKGDNKVVSRLGIDKPVDFLVGNDDDVFEMIDLYQKENKKIDCLLVDEVQFFRSYHIDQMLKVAVTLNIPVICYGLRTDFLMNGFEGSQRLLLIAHTIEELKTICTCGRKATLNGRKVNGKYVFEGEQVAIDGENHVEYQSLCTSCYFEYRGE
ncbi:thymidine kinase [Acidaminobacter sp. JC074]|uniref:thymidine kinase n=1 Tax=Acidaminobacter sp. JC074 TaxID=2530199 RepID=UPI001F0E8841|nr:thymidine kinase [Acidaminobacter sp. JC074]MCH4889363.1 thymidine kinase [Acidaminobacter sp. JC074]